MNTIKHIEKTPSVSHERGTRSRIETESDKHYNLETGKHADLANIARCSGLRRKEMSRLRGCDLVIKDSAVRIQVRDSNNMPTRLAECCGTEEELRRAAAYIKDAGDGIVFPKLPARVDMQALRVEYVQHFYEKHARRLRDVPPTQIYSCRGDKKGDIYDKEALIQTAQNAGIREISAIPAKYLRADAVAVEDQCENVYAAHIEEKVDALRYLVKEKRALFL